MNSYVVWLLIRCHTPSERAVIRLFGSVSQIFLPYNFGPGDSDNNCCDVLSIDTFSNFDFVECFDLLKRSTDIIFVILRHPHFENLQFINIYLFFTFPCYVLFCNAQPIVYSVFYVRCNSLCGWKRWVLTRNIAREDIYRAT